MCTATWWRGDGRYELFFNRDEKRTRQRALLPTIERQGDVQYVAPTDRDAGGTWLGVNEWGISVGLLNGYMKADRADRAERAFQSRGDLVRDLLGAAAVSEIEERMRALELDRFRSFCLFALDASDARLFTWDQRELHQHADADKHLPLVSSSLDPVRAGEERRALYAAQFDPRGVDRDGLMSFHHSHEPERGAFSVCMHRDDAETVSYSHVSVDHDRVRFRYLDGAPCKEGGVSSYKLRRRPG